MRLILVFALVVFLAIPSSGFSIPIDAEDTGSAGPAAIAESSASGNSSPAPKSRQTLEVDVSAICADVGGVAHFALNAGLSNADRNYLLIGGASGTVPGTLLPGGYVTLPLNLDWFTYGFVFPFLNTTYFQNFYGTIDPDGYGEATLVVPPFNLTSNITLYFAYCCNNPFDFVSNPVEIELLTLLDMVLIPAGEYEMGRHVGNGVPDELPVHAVYIDAFWMDIYEVNNEKYCDFLISAYNQGLIEVSGDVVYQAGSGASYPYCDTVNSSSYSRIIWTGSTFEITSGKEDHPMVMVSWYGAVAYANWRSAQEGLTPCYDLSTWECNFNFCGYRLPTEAEAEKAARGGEHSPYYRYPWGDYLDGSKANYLNSGDPYENGPEPKTSPVGYYDGNQIPSGVDMVNGYGLYDMAGNVWEWCNDWYDSDYYQYCVDHSIYYNPKGPLNGNRRIHRGASWISPDTRCAVRSYYYPDDMVSNTGLRLVLEIP